MSLSKSAQLSAATSAPTSAVTLSTEYRAFADSLADLLPSERVIRDYARRLAYGTDASFYRLVPQLVLKVDSEAELSQLLARTSAAKLPVTFRAAGTSLSGQALSDSILILLSDSWRYHEILDLGMQIRLGPGVIGADANRYLAPYGRKIGPDPASINSCKIGGIAANNASGMCCGTAHNSYQTLKSMRLIFQDGTVLDTGDQQSRQNFADSHGELLRELDELAAATRADNHLADKIRHKYRLKNTTGYSINALIDYDDPIDILAHLMIGSEGTLAFISEITYNTVIEHKHRASTLVFFPDIDTTCRAVTALSQTDVAAVELMDGRALLSVKDLDGMPAFVADMDLANCALLIETRAANAELLQRQIAELDALLADYPQTGKVPFTDQSEHYNKLWAIRKATFPAVGNVRENGTTVLIEDVAFPIERLSEGVLALQQLFAKYRYDEAIIFGHALAGNLHFVFTQDFSTPEEVQRYSDFMDEVCHLVAVDYQGSLKAEHGTGRNMAPYVALEWGDDAYRLMRQLKTLFDPHWLINPGVIINDDHQAHISDLKALPEADDIIDKCIECGFCEAVCPSRELTLTPRQRITTWREINRLRRSQDDPEALKELESSFQYLGVDTCAATGLCADRCPVGINTGDMIRRRRSEANQKRQPLAATLARRFALVERTTRHSLQLVNWSQRLLGNRLLGAMSHGISKLSGNRIPKWIPAMPGKANYRPLTRQSVQVADANRKVVYLPSCASRSMGAAAGAKEQRSLPEVTLSLLAKAGFEVISPDTTGQCCGMPFNSKGMFDQAEQKRQGLEEMLWQLSEQGKHPILIDTSPCKSQLLGGDCREMAIYEPVGFVEEILRPHLAFTPVDDTVMLHVTCSSRRMGLADPMLALAKRCAREVIVPEQIQCCGFAGDKGFTTPELNASALAPLKAQVPENCASGYSNSRTCEIGLSHHSGIDYQSILFLVDKATRELPATKRQP